MIQKGFGPVGQSPFDCWKDSAGCSVAGSVPVTYEFSVLLAKGGRIMAFQKGDRYRCPDPYCGCEIEVTKGAAPGKGGDQNPRCCCGKEMEKVQK